MPHIGDYQPQIQFHINNIHSLQENSATNREQIQSRNPLKRMAKVRKNELQTRVAIRQELKKIETILNNLPKDSAGLSLDNVSPLISTLSKLNSSKAKRIVQQLTNKFEFRVTDSPTKLSQSMDQQYNKAQKTNPLAHDPIHQYNRELEDKRVKVQMPKSEDSRTSIIKKQGDFDYKSYNATRPEVKDEEYQKLLEAKMYAALPDDVREFLEHDKEKMKMAFYLMLAETSSPAIAEFSRSHNLASMGAGMEGRWLIVNEIRNENDFLIDFKIENGELILEKTTRYVLRDQGDKEGNVEKDVGINLKERYSLSNPDEPGVYRWYPEVETLPASLRPGAPRAPPG